MDKVNVVLVETSSQARRFSAARFILSIFSFLLFGELLKNKIRKLVCPLPVCLFCFVFLPFLNRKSRTDSFVISARISALNLIAENR